MSGAQMLQRLLLVAALSLHSVGVAAQSQDGWEAFGPARIGETLTQLQEQVDLLCRQDADHALAHMRYCRPLPSAPRELAGAAVRDVILTFSRDRLIEVSAHYAERDFAQIKAFLTEKLGSGEDRGYRMRAGMSGELNAQVLIWENEAASVLAEQFSRRVDQSTLMYGERTLMQKLLQDKRSVPPGSMQDLPSQ